MPTTTPAHTIWSSCHSIRSTDSRIAPGVTPGSPSLQNGTHPLGTSLIFYFLLLRKRTFPRRSALHGSHVATTSFETRWPSLTPVFFPMVVTLPQLLICYSGSLEEPVPSHLPTKTSSVPVAVMKQTTSVSHSHSSACLLTLTPYAKTETRPFFRCNLLLLDLSRSSAQLRNKHMKIAGTVVPINTFVCSTLSKPLGHGSSLGGMTNPSSHLSSSAITYLPDK